jgi:hypothetical protein
MVIMMPVSHRFSTSSTYSIAPTAIDDADVSSLRLAVPICRKSKTCLPESFQPHAYSVILGRGRTNDHVGNKRLKVMVEMELDNFVRAKSRREKSFVVARVMETIQDACNGEGAFVRNEQGRWYEVDDSTAREKISTQFRDRLSDQYKSSTSNKIERRRQRKALERSSDASISQSEQSRSSTQQDSQIVTGMIRTITGANYWSDCSSDSSVL